MLLQKKKCYNYFKKCINDIDTKKTVKQKYATLRSIIKKEKSPETFLDLQQYIINNRRYLEDKRTMMGQASQTQRFIIENIGKYENKDKRFLTEKVVADITEKLNKKFKDEYYKSEDVEATIRKIFNIGKDDRFNGLRLK